MSWKIRPAEAVSDGPEAYFLHDKFGFAAAQQDHWAKSLLTRDIETNAL